MPLLAVLADPDKASLRQLSEWAYRSSQSEVDMLLIGGSLLERERLELCVDALKKAARKPVVLFPGNFFAGDSTCRCTAVSESDLWKKCRAPDWPTGSSGSPAKKQTTGNYWHRLCVN